MAEISLDVEGMMTVGAQTTWNTDKSKYNLSIETPLTKERVKRAVRKMDRRKLCGQPVEPAVVFGMARRLAFWYGSYNSTLLPRWSNFAQKVTREFAPAFTDEHHSEQVLRNFVDDVWDAMHEGEFQVPLRKPKTKRPRADAAEPAPAPAPAPAKAPARPPPFEWLE